MNKKKNVSWYLQSRFRCATQLKISTFTYLLAVIYLVLLFSCCTGCTKNSVASVTASPTTTAAALTTANTTLVMTPSGR